MQQVKLPPSMPTSHMSTNLLPIQLPVNVPGEVAEDGSSAWGPCQLLGRHGWGFWLLASAWPSPGHYGHLGSEPVNKRSLYLSVSPFRSITLPFKNKTKQSHTLKKVIFFKKDNKNRISWDCPTFWHSHFFNPQNGSVKFIDFLPFYRIKNWGYTCICETCLRSPCKGIKDLETEPSIV